MLIPPGSLKGDVAVVVDVLRATTVMVHALAAGCEAVIPCAHALGWSGGEPPFVRRIRSGSAEPIVRAHRRIWGARGWA